MSTDTNKTAPVTALAAPLRSAMTLPSEGTPERVAYAQAAADMSDVIAMAETSPRAIVLWHGTERCVSDLVRAWRKLAVDAERKRMADAVEARKAK